MKRAIIATIVLLVNLLIVGFIYEFICTPTSFEPFHDTQTFAIEALYEYEVAYETYAQGILEGDFTITGGERAITFYITNPHGYTVFGPYSFTSHGEFRLQTLYIGIYSLIFENWSYYDRYIILHIHGYQD